MKFNPLLGLVNLKLGKIQLLLENLPSALTYLKEAAEILKITHGEHSKYVKSHLTPVLADAQKRYNYAQRHPKKPEPESESDD